MSDSTVVITDNSEVVLHFDLKLSDGSAADSTRVNNKPAKLVIGDGNLTPGFESCLLGLVVGDKKSFTLEPKDHLDRSKFDGDTPAEEGMIMTFSQPDGSELPGIVRSVAGASVTVDFNHPLAGQTITFDVEIISVV